jgi:hypothetical protein
VTIRLHILAFALFGVISLPMVTQPATAQSVGNEALRGTESPSFSLDSQPGLTCSPAPCVLPPTLASEGTGFNLNSPIAADPLSPRQLIVASLDTNCGHSDWGGIHISSDAGSTWSTSCMGNLFAFGQLWDPLGLPLVSYDLKGSAYVAQYYQYCQSDGFNCYSVIGIEKSTDGEAWMGPFTALGSASSVIFWASLAVDQTPSSPYANSIYVFGTNIAINSQVLVSRSRDGGSTWNVSQLFVDKPHELTFDYNPSLTVGKDGTVYTAWMHCPLINGNYCGNGTEFMVFSKSADGGVTWSPPKLVTTLKEVPNQCMCFPFGLVPNTDIGAPNTPALGIDNSNGPFAGRLYATMFDWTGTYMRVQVIHSSDGGTTWSKPVPVAPPSDTHDQFFPWLSVSPTGLVGVSWLDRRNDPANIDYQAYAAISSDGGESFQPNIQLTTAFSNPNNNGKNGLGSYAGNTWDGPNYFVAAWMDTSNGISSQDYVGGIRLH